MDPLVLLDAEQRRDRLADRDERGRARHLDQRKAAGVGRLDQPGRADGVREADADAERRDARVDEPVDVVDQDARVVGRQPHPGGQQDLAALQERGGVLQLGHRHPAHRPVAAVGPGQQREPEARAAR